MGFILYAPLSRLFMKFLPAVALCLSLLSASGFGVDAEQPLSFVKDVAPILTKATCNSASCHAKAGVGQRGFRLSVLGFETEEDYEHIVKEGRGRRVFPAAPEQSLLLLKAANIVPHGGGKRLDPKSEDYKIMLRWISQGMPYRLEGEATLVSLEVQPPRGLLPVKTQQQLKVVAHYSDGGTRDVTHTALYEANDKGMAEVTEGGLIKVLDLPGSVAVMVRYQTLSSVCNVSVPLGAPVKSLPPAKNFIDELVFANLKQMGVPPSPLCDDSTFFRRVSLDIAGRLPTEGEAKVFLADTAPNKREVFIKSLVASPDYANYFANKWSALLHNKREAPSDIIANFAFYSWLRDSFLANIPYDQVVRQLLTATGEIVSNPAAAWYKRVKEPQRQIEDLAQVFLGVRMQCVQCHHHPFEHWSQRDYYSLSAFFSQVGRVPTSTTGEDVIFHKRGVAQQMNIKTNLPEKPAALGAPTLDIPPEEDPRGRLSDWMSQKENPFFAKALVNRYWKHFFRRGLVEPEDDMRDTNPPTNPELLDALAGFFIKSGFDLKALVQVITQSNTYQLGSAPNEHNGIDRQNYSRFYPKRLPAEVLLDSIDQLAGAQSNFPDLPLGTRAIALPDSGYTNGTPFLKAFGRPEGISSCECERVQSSNLSQSLLLLNAASIKTKLTVGTGRAARLAKSESSDSEKISELYLAAFSRNVRAAELQFAQEFLSKARLDVAGKPLAPLLARQEAYEDLLWALINAKEFMFNH